MQNVDRWGMRGFGAAGHGGSWAKRLVVAAMLLVAMFLTSTVGTAAADEFGYCTVSGVGGVAEDTPYGTFSEALAAINACDPALQTEGANVSIVVHGTISIDVQESATGVFEFAYPVAGASWSIIGADGAHVDAYDATGAWRPLALSNASGGLSLRGLSVGYPLSLSSGGTQTIEGCTFESPVSCGSWGSVVVSGNYLTAWEPTAQAALSVGLLSPGSTFSFSGNQVDSHAVAVACSVADATSHVSFVQNSFSIDGAAVDPISTLPCAVLLEGGPWGPSSITYQENGFISNGGSSTFVLGSSFSVADPYDANAPAQSVSNDSLAAVAVSTLFDQRPVGSPETAVALEPSRGGTVSAAEVGAASRSLLGIEDMAQGGMSPLITITYDSNGATAGLAPEPVQLEPGESMVVSHMGSLANSGYVFEGWSTEPDGSGTFYAVGQVILPEADMVLYAQWVPTGTVGTYAVTSAEAPNADLELEAA